ncbi:MULTISPECIES: dephospho-CoA kinase [Kitasatospora]|uniref:dephospho-CoA kinase n=1 Tax=Kitasatospora TaxID=2063 RepID=UPI0004C3604A|nr:MULTISPECIES: dephospho-CoA kinase [unclassified Kitasatospora]WAL71281.1 dephospho-CoA kinase [Kitasatospora sp. YST-16]WNW37318.1 dephospho-CoA kinase [Streptomyces sp. Li-HN-5-13]
MLRIGLTGGIGAGKSEVSRQLAAHGAVIVDSDVIAREVVAPGTPGLAAVAAEFGPGVLLPDGALDRPALGRIVFADPDRLAKLNAVVHPLVRARSAELEAAAGPDAIVVHDVPLLAENGLAPLYDLVVVIDVPDAERLRRLVALRGMAEDEAKARMAAQATREARLAVADLVLDNSGDLEQLTARVDELWQQLERRRG